MNYSNARAIMDYERFSGVLNRAMFTDAKPKLIKNIANYPERYVGLFRPTKPQAKLIQNLTQSHEIRFGGAFEKLIEAYLNLSGFVNIEKSFVAEDGKSLQVDQVFSDQKNIYFVEQKIRDDHDSTKKRGQIDNFEKKISAISKCHYESSKGTHGFFYFIDDTFNKNQSYYAEELPKLSQAYGVPLDLVYGAQFFEKLQIGCVWNEIIAHLTRWKKEIPEMPEINFDANPEDSADKIKNLESGVLRKLFNSDLDDVLAVLFPNGETLHLLSAHFTNAWQTNKHRINQTLQEQCNATIARLQSRKANN